MRQRRRHRPHCAQPGHVDQLRLQVLHLMRCALPFGQIADKAGEEALAPAERFADREFDRKSLAAAPPGGRQSDHARTDGATRR